VGAYGSSYCKAAKDTLNLIRLSGMGCIANDDLVDGVISTIQWMCALTIACIGAITAKYAFVFDWKMILVISLGAMIIGSYLPLIFLHINIVYISTFLVYIYVPCMYIW
jgi:hypothetical protein